jgi:shikimate dehydrogenase
MIRGAVLGSPIEHSLSPVLHRAAFVELQIEGSYDRIEVGAGEVKNFLSERGSEFDYLSLTMPLKEEVLQLGFATSDLALKSQSANTLIKRFLTSSRPSGLLGFLIRLNPGCRWNCSSNRGGARWCGGFNHGAGTHKHA